MPVTADDVRRALAPRLERLRAIPGVRVGYVPDTTNLDAGYSFWGTDGERFFIAARERGRETFRDETDDLDELLYWICRTVVREAARPAAVGSPRHLDQRRARFAREEELLGAVDPAWGDRCRAEHAEILARYPYRDRR